MNGTDKDVWDKAVKDVSLDVQGHSMKLDFHVMNMTRADVVLGDVPSSPLICNAELMSLSKDNAIESYYLCYFLSSCLTTNECMNGDLVKVNGASSSASMSHFNSSLLLKESSPSKHNTNISSI